MKMPPPPAGKNPPCAVMFVIDQEGFVRNTVATTRDIPTIPKKKMLESIPVRLMSKFDSTYQTNTMPIAT